MVKLIDRPCRTQPFFLLYFISFSTDAKAWRWQGISGSSLGIRDHRASDHRNKIKEIEKRVVGWSDPIILEVNFARERTESVSRDSPRCGRTTPSVHPGGHGRLQGAPPKPVRARVHRTLMGMTILLFVHLRHGNRKILKVPFRLDDKACRCQSVHKICLFAFGGARPSRMPALTLLGNLCGRDEL